MIHFLLVRIITVDPYPTVYVPTYFGRPMPPGTDILIELVIIGVCLWGIYHFGQEFLYKLRWYRENK